MTDNREEIRKNLIAEVRFKIDSDRDVPDDEIKRIIAREVAGLRLDRRLSLQERERLSKEVYDAIRKMDILQDMLEDSDITEIMINGYDNIFVERCGKVEKSEVRFDSESKLEDVIQKIVAGCNRTVNGRNPIADARLSGGERVNIVLSPPALDGAVITIRRFPDEVYSLDDLVAKETLTSEAAEFLKKAVYYGYNIYISGGTSSGKTTLLNALAACIPADSRVITIEDSAELRIKGIPNLVRLETRNSTADGCNEITIRDLIKSALRMRPDRIIVGETRGAEALDMLQAMNTGHDGSLSTGHANSASDMLLRIETMVLMGSDLPIGAIRRQIASGVDLIVHLDRLRNHKRYVTQIVELCGMNGEDIVLKEIFGGEFDGGGFRLIKTGKLSDTRKWIAGGGEEDEL